MYSQTYGTIPLTSRVGGLVDTVIDADEDSAGGTGLTFPPNAIAMREALERALKLFADKPRFATVRQRGMQKDFGWAKAAKAYEELYRDSL
jgi:starch synthase